MLGANLYSANHAGATALPFAFHGEGEGPIHLDDTACTGTETTLISCPYNPTDNCRHFEDAGVRCQGCVTGEVRLIEGQQASEGRVEVCRSNVWGTVCDDFWGAMDASVVCRQLGYSRIGAIARVAAFFGAGRGDIFLDDVMCNGTEERLTDCAASDTENCIHAEDAGVTCRPICEYLSICNYIHNRAVGSKNELVRPYLHLETLVQAPLIDLVGNQEQ